METAINAMAAYNQAGFIVGGIFILLIGAALLAGDFYYRFTALRVKGHIKAVRAQGNLNENAAQKYNEVYYPVYEYKNRHGETIKAESNSGSSLLSNKEPGREVSLLVLPHKPLQALEEGNALLLTGLVFLMAAAGLFVIAFSLFAMSVFTLITLAAFAIFGLAKFVTSIIPKEKRGTVEEWQQKRQREFVEKRNSMRLLTAEEYYERVRAMDQLYKKWMPVYILIGLGLLGGGYYTGRDTFELLQGVRMPGEVIGIDSHSTNNGTIYNAVVRYQNEKGQVVEFKDRAGGSVPFNQTGDKVEVLYDPQKPSRMMIDRGVWNWALPGLLLVPGLLTLLLCLKSSMALNRRLMRR